jgi:hypothetical protein
MWIELTEDIDKCLENITNPMSKYAIALNTVFDSMIKGLHIVYASRKRLDNIQKADYINPSIKYFIEWIKCNYVYIYSCKSIVDYKIIITLDSEIVVKGNTFYVPLIYFYDFRETKFLTENESDADFFRYIYEFIRKDKKIADMYSICLENDSFHGGNVQSKILQIAKENRIALCIVDSDREMKGRSRGSTFGGANKVYSKIKANHVFVLRELESREKENLLPPYAYLLICKEKKDVLQALNACKENEKIIRYFDIKDGIKLGVFEDKVWQNYYKDLIDKLNNLGAIHQPASNKDKKFVCIDGIGGFLCEEACRVYLDEKEVSEDIINKRNIDEETKELIRNLRMSFKENLPTYMYKEWEEIHKIMFSWGCCISKNRLPNYRM